MVKEVIYSWCRYLNEHEVESSRKEGENKRLIPEVPEMREYGHFGCYR